MTESEERNLERYADLVLALAEPNVDRNAILGEHGLDEVSFAELEAHWLQRLEEAEDAHGSADGAPALLVRYAHALGRAQAQRAKGAMAIEKYAEITRALGSGRDTAQLLERYGTTLSTYLNAHAYWTGRAARETDIATKLAALLR